jgi:predicted esterase
MQSMKKSHPFTIPSTLRVVILAALLGLVSVPAALGGDDDKDFGKLGRQLRGEYNSGNYEAALKTAEKMHEMQPSHMETMYNMACLHCQLGHKDKAYEWLEKAIVAGYKDADALLNDGDFSRIRAEDRFRKIVRKIRVEPGAGAKKSSADEADEDKPIEKKPKKAAPKDAEDKDISAEEATEKINELTSQLIQSAESKDYDKSLKIAREAYGLSKKIDNPALRSMTAYNMACMYSLTKEPDDAFKYLEESIDLGGGFSRNIVSQIENDTDLDNIRKDERYAKMMEKVKGGQKAAGSGNVGRKVESKFELRPPKSYNKAEPAPLLIVLHGHGENMKKAREQWAAAADKAGAVLLTIQGSQAMPNGAYHWGDNLDAIEETLMASMDQAMEQYKIDKKKIVLGGFSQGGWIAYAMALRNPDTFRGIIPVAGLCKPESESAFKDDELGKLRVFIMVGKKDSAEVIQSNEKAAKRFEKVGATVSLNEYKNAAHEFPANADEELAKAVEFVLRD